MKKGIRAIVVVLCVIMILSAVMTAVDFCRLCYGAFEMPLFAVCTQSMQDGGSGLYRGLFHTIQIKGNFMPEDEYPGVTHFIFYIFGVKVHEGIRD